MKSLTSFKKSLAFIVVICLGVLWLYPPQYIQKLAPQYMSLPNQTLPNEILPDETAFGTIPFDPCSCKRSREMILQSFPNLDNVLSKTSLLSSCSDLATARGPGQKVVSYSLFGKFLGGYYNGMHFLIPRVREMYPGWILRIYMNLTKRENHDWACTISCQNPHVDVCEVSKIPDLPSIAHQGGSIWRFMPLGDPLVERFAVRDADSPIIQREVDAVNEWVQLGQCFHFMRDNPGHGFVIMGGMWGGCNTWNLTMNQEIRRDMLTQQTGVKRDQMLLKNFLWPIAKNNCTPHAAFYCKQYKNARPFPTQRQDYNFIGSTALKKNRTIYFNRICPPECRPKDHQDWELC